MQQSEVNEREWNTPTNWRFGVYHAPRDTRVWVPKPAKWMGWTLNFAHRAAYLWLVVLLLPAVVIVAVSVAVTLRR